MIFLNPSRQSVRCRPNPNQARDSRVFHQANTHVNFRKIVRLLRLRKANTKGWKSYYGTIGKCVALHFAFQYQPILVIIFQISSVGMGLLKTSLLSTDSQSLYIFLVLQSQSHP